MRYQRRKEFTAFLSVFSVAITMTAALTMNLLIDGFTRSFTVITAGAAAIAALAASMSIMLSRHLDRERERRRVFLIYAREDLEAARRLAGELREYGFNPWLDVEEITAGQVWQKAVIRALEESVVALVLVSQHLAKKGFVQEELKVALETLQERERDLSPVVP
ncbi:MAG: toll/interleukin-1 receptor domain-containing protein [candidate division NC10 bacterium]|nr:toll/interleukin-1 receptor domain-containing protein [candidate division NC10 bacterium]